MPSSASARSPSIEMLIRDFAAELESAIRADVELRLRQVLEQLVPTVAARSAPVQRQATSRRMRLCPVEGCGAPAAGPMYGWKCRAHGARSRTKASGLTTSASVKTATPVGEMPTPSPSASSVATGVTAQLARDGRRNRLCTIAGCSAPAAGPKYGWKCREHGAAYRAKAIAGSSAAPRAIAAQAASPQKTSPTPVAMLAPKAATIIPANVVIKKLPPGPVPRDAKRAGPPMECRCPGCLMKSRGPHYEFFCADHYAAFSAEERRKYTEMWKAGRQAQGG